MENHISRNWPVWMVIGFMGFSFYWVAQSWNTSSPIASAEELSYQMIRPQAFEAEYDLSGRKVVRSFDKSQRVASADGPEALRQPLNANKAAPTAPKKDDKKKKTAAKDQKKKSTVSTRFIPADKKSIGGGSNSLNGGTTDAGGYYGGGFSPTAQVQAAEAQKKDESKVSAAQWREILLSQPTAENANAFAAAFAKGDVEGAAFYSIANELLSSADLNRQQAGLQVLRNDSSANGFALLAKHYNSTSTPTDLKSSIYTVLSSYGSASKIAVLSRVLYSSDENTVLLAAQILDETIAAQASNVQVSGDRGGIRQPGSSAPIAKAQWVQFLSPLQRLSASANASLAERAQDLLNRIQALTTA